MEENSSGPSIEWREPINEHELQGWFRPEPVYWTLAFSKKPSHEPRQFVAWKMHAANGEAQASLSHPTCF
jgi:hypothetical protein